MPNAYVLAGDSWKSVSSNTKTEGQSKILPDMNLFSRTLVSIKRFFLFLNLPVVLTYV